MLYISIFPADNWPPRSLWFYGHPFCFEERTGVTGKRWASERGPCRPGTEHWAPSECWPAPAGGIPQNFLGQWVCRGKTCDYVWNHALALRTKERLGVDRSRADFFSWSLVENAIQGRDCGGKGGAVCVPRLRSTWSLQWQRLHLGGIKENSDIWYEEAVKQGGSWKNAADFELLQWMKPDMKYCWFFVGFPSLLFRLKADAMDDTHCLLPILKGKGKSKGITAIMKCSKTLVVIWRTNRTIWGNAKTLLRNRLLLNDVMLFFLQKGIIWLKYFFTL